MAIDSHHAGLIDFVCPAQRLKSSPCCTPDSLVMPDHNCNQIQGQSDELLGLIRLMWTKTLEPRCFVKSLIFLLSFLSAPRDAWLPDALLIHYTPLEEQWNSISGSDLQACSHMSYFSTLMNAFCKNL